MTDRPWQLAQLNVGRLLAPLDSEALAGFVAALEPINALADGHPGFIWRLQTDAGDATSIRPTEDDLFLINMSVWSSLETLRAFVYTTEHVQILRQRRAWFEQLAASHMVLWWVPAGHIPTIDEALERLEQLRQGGPTHAAFTFRAPFEPKASDPRDPLVDAEFCYPALPS
ncbi:MAG: DUF3291 domain-containing protein [Candidatus Limnocylindrales bacterium]